LQVFPEQITFKGGDDTRQLVVSGIIGDKQIDVTTDAKVTVTNAAIAKVLPSGRVIPLSNGKTELIINHAGKSAKVPVEVKQVGEDLPINFPNQIVPIFTKLGCNAGGCHGKASGQNGFRLSLLGFEPELDYQTLVKEGRGRRLFPAAPDESLLLLKAAGGMAHGGGKRTEVGSDEYRLIRRWIAAGTPFGKPEDPKVTRISVTPEHRVMARHNKQQFSVQAHYSDGT